MAATKAKKAVVARGHVVPDLPLWNHAARIGGGLTPARIAAIIRMADAGEIRQLMDLANECRQRDPHLHAVLGTHEESLASLAWHVTTANEKSRAKDKRAAQWIDGQLRANPNVQRMLADLAGAAFYSFAVVEIVWRKTSGRLVPDVFLPIAPRRFRFSRVDGALKFADDGMTESDLQATYANKFIVSRPRVTGDVPSREGLCRLLVWISMMRNWVLGDWMKTGEMSWKPWRIGTYKKEGAQHQDRTDLETVLRRMSTDNVAIIPDSTQIKVEWPQGSTQRSSTHAELANVLAQEMSKAVLGQTETTQASTSSGYGQAKVHDAVRRELREARARAIAADVTRDLVTPMLRLNFGDTVEVPRFEFITKDPVDLEPFARSMKALREAGTDIPQAYVRDITGIPEPKAGEPLLGAGAEKPPEENNGTPTADETPVATDETPEAQDD